MSLEFSEKLIGWFWEHGVKRSEGYTISTSDWTKNLYECNKELALVREAVPKERPAFAIWGPSQTGKSTLVSAYIDEKAVFVRKQGEDGKGSALHWEGGTPFFFMLPKDIEIDKEPPPPWLNVLNPFVGGKDASACLSRFVYASLKKEPGVYHVQSPDYPVQLHLVQEKDLLLTLARGYDTECLGPSNTGLATRWTLGKFQEALGDFKSRHQGAPVAPKREAYELLHDFCEVLDDLVFAELPRFVELLEEGEANWNSVLGSLLAEKILISNTELVEEFAAQILWDGYEVLTAYYHKLNAARHKYQGLWKGRNVHCSLKVASLLLDMDASRLFFEGVPAHAREGDREKITYDSIAKLGYEIVDSRVNLGIDLPNRFIRIPEDFGIMQGLVWEMVVPLNPANLPDSPFLQFIKKADLLDFPGVGNEAANVNTKIDCDPDASVAPAAPTAQDGGEGGVELRRRGVPFTPQLFFTQILKRGKTASIVSTYAKRLTIDGFNIFQNIDKYPPVNAIQLQTGIHTWWKSMIPEYYHHQEGPSPLPLNLALCWWANMINQAPPNAATILGNTEHIWKALGKIGRPDIASTFALNYYSFVRGRIIDKEFSINSNIYGILKSEPAFLSQFNSLVSRTSFDRMAEDKKTGGTNYFFEQLCQQAEQCRANPSFNRTALLKQKEERCLQRIKELLTGNNIFPPPKIINIRLVNLERLEASLRESIEGKQEKDMRAVNYVLREFLDINYGLLNMVPRDLCEINEQFIREQYQKWINSQVERYRSWLAKGRKGMPDWSLLGIGSEGLFRDYLDSLARSVEPDLKEIVSWLRRLAQYRAAAPALVRSDLRPHLAVKMANALVYGPNGVESYEDAAFGMDMLDELDEDGPGTAPLGVNCPSYQVFIKPFLEYQMKRLLRLEVDQPGRENVIGDQELKALCAEYGMTPDLDNTPSATE